jgi:hypothetical protein
VGWWGAHPDAWPVDHLTVGDEDLDQQALLDLLCSGGREAVTLLAEPEWQVLLDLRDDCGGGVVTRLAREVVATKFNLAVGSDPWILPDLEAADAFLVDFPLGSTPTGEDKRRAKELRKPLVRYNSDACDDE